MTIRRDKGELVAECENCGAEEYGGTLDPSSQDDFRQFVADLKAQGWRVYKDGEDWCHDCPTCGGR